MVYVGTLAATTALAPSTRQSTIQQVDTMKAHARALNAAFKTDRTRRAYRRRMRC